VSLPAIDVAAPTSRADVGPALGKSAALLVDIANIIRSAAPSDALAYRIARYAVFMTIEGPPDARGSRTLIEPPHTLTIELMTDYRQAQSWAELVGVCEEAFPGLPYWLEPHYLTALALDRQGFTAARDDVVRLLLHLVERLPMLLEATFSDGRPLLSSEGRSWFDGEAARFNRGGGGNAAAPDPLDELTKAADELAARGQLAEALQTVNQLMAKQGHLIETVAIEELKTRRARLEVYQTQARYAVADSYDRAAKVQDSPTPEVAAAPAGGGQ
jgi:type VI secretion system ImpA/VasJ family protein